MGGLDWGQSAHRAGFFREFHFIITHPISSPEKPHTYGTSYSSPSANVSPSFSPACLASDLDETIRAAAATCLRHRHDGTIERTSLSSPASPQLVDVDIARVVT